MNPAGKKGAKGGGKDLHEPVQACPLKASITVQVDAVNDEDGTREGVAGVSAQLLSGPSGAPVKKTSGAGLASFPGLTPGSYEVGIKVEGGMTKFYDLIPPPVAQTKSVGGGGAQIYEFELRSNWIGARILLGVDKPSDLYNQWGVSNPAAWPKNRNRIPI